MKTITINGKDYNVKYTIRALFIFEQITGKPFNISTLLDNYVFFYSMLLANNTDDCITWDDFVDALDADPKLFQQISEVVDATQKQDEVFAVADDKGEKKN